MAGYRQRSAARRRRKAYAVLTGEGIVRSAAGETERGTAVERGRLSDDALSALASRSFVDHGAIPAHMVRPEPKGRARRTPTISAWKKQQWWPPSTSWTPVTW